LSGMKYVVPSLPLRYTPLILAISVLSFLAAQLGHPTGRYRS
jgi:hypothetical protein